MKRVKIMLSAIMVLALVAGALAFKAKKVNGFCLYQTTTTLNAQEEQITICRTLNHYIQAELPNAVILDKVFTTPTTCTTVPTVTATINCVKKLTVTIE